MKRPYLDPMREALAVAALKDHLAALAADGDEVLLRDAIEGETSFGEAVDMVLRQIRGATSFAEACASEAAAINARKARFELRAERLRAGLERAFAVADLAKLERPGGTVSLRVGVQKVEVTDENLIPAPYWKQPPKVLDRAALRDHLKAGQVVTGATLSNGAPVLTIRVA